MPEIPPLGEMSRSDKRGAVSARRKLSRSGATRLKRLEAAHAPTPVRPQVLTPSVRPAGGQLPLTGEGCSIRKADAPGLFSVLCIGLRVRRGFPDAGNSPVGGNVT